MHGNFLPNHQIKSVNIFITPRASTRGEVISSVIVVVVVDTKIA